MDVEVWICLLFAFSIVAVLGSWFVRAWNLGKSPWLSVFTILLEVSPSVNTALESRLQYSLVLGPILFTAIIIANGYKGILTADLTAAPPWKGLETFDDVWFP